MESGRRRKLFLGIGSGLVILAMAIVGGAALVDGYLQRYRQGQVESEAATLQVLDNVQATLGGKKPVKEPTFPDTELGRLAALSYKMSSTMAADQRKYESDLLAAKWDTLLLPASMKTKADVETSISIIGKARNLLTGFERRSESVVSQTLVAMQKGARSKNGRDFFAGFRTSLEKKGNGLHTLRTSFSLARKNHDALEDAMQVLLRISGRYKVFEDGSVEMGDDVPDADVDAYNDAVDRINSTLDEIEKLYENRRDKAVDEIKKIRDRLR
jgi:hypothetical protein